jgi:UDP-N-acetylglucosamine/UDP-N-acetylgalactosamine diphosphorylase
MSTKEGQEWQELMVKHGQQHLLAHL